MIELDSEPRLRVFYLGQTSVPARSVLRTLTTLPDVDTLIELSDELQLPEYLASHQPHVVLLDAGITEGSALRYELAELLPHIEMPVIALVGAEREQRGIQAVRDGASAYLTVERCLAPTLRETLALVQERRAFDDALRLEHAPVDTLLGGVNDGVMVMSVAGRVLHINGAARRLLGVPRDFWPDATWQRNFGAIDSFDGGTIAPDERPFARLAVGQSFSDLACLYETPHGEAMHLQTHGRQIRDEHERVIAHVLTLQDDSLASEHAHRDTVIDTLTGTIGQRDALRHIKQALARAERSQRTLGLVMVNIDNFRSVNSSFGHDIGDMLLQGSCERLMQLVRQGDVLARWQGDTFMILLENLAGPRDAVAVANKVLRQMADKFVCGRFEVHTSASVGVALAAEAGNSANVLVEAALQALQSAKSAGGARLHFYSTSPMEHDTTAHELEIGLRHALLRRELTLRYQPRINLATGRLTGFEVFLRWQHPRFGLLPPARFLSLLESSGLIHSVGEWMVKTVCAQIQAWQHRYNVPDLSMSINLSAVQLAKGRLPEIVAQCIDDLNLDPGWIEFELAEGAQCLQRPAERSAIEKLRKLGVGIILDHFGTGDVSFAALDPALITGFVLHQSLINHLATDDELQTRHRAMVRAVIAMADGLDIQVGAEGVESAEQLAFLREARCASAQGYFIAQPVEPEKIAALLHSESLGTPLYDDASAA